MAREALSIDWSYASSPDAKSFGAYHPTTTARAWQNLQTSFFLSIGRIPPMIRPIYITWYPAWLVSADQATSSTFAQKRNLSSPQLELNYNCIIMSLQKRAKAVDDYDIVVDRSCIGCDNCGVIVLLLQVSWCIVMRRWFCLELFLIISMYIHVACYCCHYNML